MKSAPRVESISVKPKQKRRNRARPTPRWLKAPAADGPEEIAQRRCLLVLAVLSGEQPVTDAIEASGISRQLYYQLEEKALKAMMRALGPSTEDDEHLTQTLSAQLEAAQARVRELETQKRRAERLLLLTRKLVRPGGMTVGRGGRPRKYPRRSTQGGKPSSKKSTEKMLPADTSSPAPTSEPLP